MMMDVMKFHTGRKSGFEHFHMDKCCDRFDLVRRQVVHKFVHQGPPCPETVRGVLPPRLGHTGHGPLESMAMCINRRRQENTDMEIGV